MGFKKVLESLMKYSDKEELRRALTSLTPEGSRIDLYTLIDELRSEIRPERSVDPSMLEENYSVLEDTVPTEPIVDLLRKIDEFVHKGETQTVSFLEEYGTGKSHALAFICDVLKSIKEDPDRIESRIYGRIKRIQKYRGKNKKIKEYLNNKIKSELEKLGRFSRKENIAIVVLGIDDIVDVSKPIYVKILERLGIKSASSKPEKARNALLADQRLKAIIADELQLRYERENPYTKDEIEFFKLAASEKSKRLFIAVAMNPIPDKEKQKDLEKIHEALRRNPISKDTKEEMRHYMALWALEAERYDIDIAEDTITRVESLLLKGHKENILRDRIRIGMVRLAAYIASNIEYPLFSGLFPPTMLRFMKTYKLSKYLDYLSALRFLDKVLEERKAKDIAEKRKLLAKALLFSTDLSLPLNTLERIFGGSLYQIIRGYPLFKVDGETVYLVKFREILEHEVAEFMEEASDCINRGEGCDKALETLKHVLKADPKELIRKAHERALKSFEALVVSESEPVGALRVRVLLEEDRLIKDLLEQILEKLKASMSRRETIGPKDLAAIALDALIKLDVRNYRRIVRQEESEVKVGSYHEYNEFLRRYRSKIRIALEKLVGSLGDGEYTLSELIERLKEELRTKEPLERIVNEPFLRGIVEGKDFARRDNKRLRIMRSTEKRQREELKKKVERIVNVVRRRRKIDLDIIRRELGTLKALNEKEKREELKGALKEGLKDLYVFRFDGENILVYDLSEIDRLDRGSYLLMRLDEIAREIIRDLDIQYVEDVDEALEHIRNAIDVSEIVRPSLRIRLRKLLEQKKLEKLEKEKPKKQKRKRVRRLILEVPEDILEEVKETIRKKYPNIKIIEERLHVDPRPL